MDIIYSILRISIWSHEKRKTDHLCTQIFVNPLYLLCITHLKYTKWLLTRRRTFIRPSHCAYFLYSSYISAIYVHETYTKWI